MLSILNQQLKSVIDMWKKNRDAGIKFISNPVPNRRVFEPGYLTL